MDKIKEKSHHNDLRKEKNVNKKPGYSENNIIHLFHKVVDKKYKQVYRKKSTNN